MDYSGLLGQVAPTTVQQGAEQAIQQAGQQQTQQIQQQMAPLQMQQAQIANQAAQQDFENKKLDMGISFLSPILNEPDPTKQQALIKTLVPMFNRYVPNTQLDPDNTDANTIRALVQSRISPEQQATFQQQRAMAMGGMGMGGAQGTGIFPNTSPGMNGIINPPPQGAPAQPLPDNSQPIQPTQPGGSQGGGQAAPPDGQPPQATLVEAPKPTVDTNYLNQVKMMNPMVGTMADNMIAGTFKPESGKGENDPVYVAALAVARKADPTFNAQSMMGRPAMVDNATHGKLYNDQVNLNSVTGHLYDLNDAIDGLNSQAGHGTWTNGIANTLSQGLDTAHNDPLQRFKQVRDLATEELAKFYGGGTSSDSSRKTAQDAFNENQDPATLKANIINALGMIDSRATTDQNEYNKTMGAAGGNFNILEAKSPALTADIMGKDLTPQQQALVNQHRAASNLPPKTWQTPTQPQTAQQQAQGMLKQPAAPGGGQQPGAIVTSKNGVPFVYLGGDPANPASYKAVKNGK